MHECRATRILRQNIFTGEGEEMNDSNLQNNDNNQQQTELENTISDLPVAEAQQDQVKGGPIYMHVEGVTGSVTTVGFEKRME
jgi:hypothetical protein